MYPDLNLRPRKRHNGKQPSDRLLYDRSEGGRNRKGALERHDPESEENGFLLAHREVNGFRKKKTYF